MDPARSSTRIGAHRDRYADEIEPRPPRFTNPDNYQAWAARADNWVAPPIPDTLCGVNGCTYTPHHGQHTWEEKADEGRASHANREPTARRRSDKLRRA